MPDAQITFPTGVPQRLVLGRYRLETRIAVGGMAEVWRAHDEQLDRPVAVKLLHEHLALEPRARQRLATEARAVAALRHPAIVSVLDLDLDSPRPAIVFELVEGRSLAGLLHDGPLPSHRAAAIVAEVAAALEQAHREGIVHRDVKPGNIILDADGHAHLVDFGIAYAVAEGSDHLTLTGTVAGTLRYMAPEQLSDEPITPRTDLFALGVVLHELLSGRVPYQAAAPVALARQQAVAALTLSGIEPALGAIIRGCLARRPEARPASAELVAEALHAWLDGDPRPALALAPGPRRRALHISPVLAARRRLAAGRRRFVAVRRPLIAGLATGVAMTLLGFAVAAGGGSSPPQVSVGTPGGAVTSSTVSVGDASGEVTAPPAEAETLTVNAADPTASPNSGDPQAAAPVAILLASAGDHGRAVAAKARTHEKDGAGHRPTDQGHGARAERHGGHGRHAR
ncbi:MAG TPA: protein kinase [Gemmatimonadaceae bacterium]|nr:protein kinase [Gemmatimonadaceae bacterium]